MKCVFFVLAIFVLSFSACAGEQTESEPPDPVVSVDGNSGASVKNDLTANFKSLCREAAIVADGHLDGLAKPEETQSRLYEISEKMMAEYYKLDGDETEKIGAAAIMLVMSLHDSVYKNSAEDIALLKDWRDVLSKLAE